MKKRQKERLIQRFLNKFEVLKSKVMNVGEDSRMKKKRLLKEIMMKIELK